MPSHHLISSSVVPFSSRRHSFLESGFILVSQFFASAGQSIGSFSFSISPSNEHPGLISFRMDWLISLQPKGLWRVFSNTTVQKHQFFSAQAFFIVQLSHPYISLSLVAKLCPTLATPWTVACQASLSMRFSRQQYWSGLPFPSPGGSSQPKDQPRSPELQADSLPIELWEGKT